MFVQYIYSITYFGKSIGDSIQIVLIVVGGLLFVDSVDCFLEVVFCHHQRCLQCLQILYFEFQRFIVLPQLLYFILALLHCKFGLFCYSCSPIIQFYLCICYIQFSLYTIYQSIIGINSLVGFYPVILHFVYLCTGILQ